MEQFNPNAMNEPFHAENKITPNEIANMVDAEVASTSAEEKNPGAEPLNPEAFSTATEAGTTSAKIPTVEELMEEDAA